MLYDGQHNTRQLLFFFETQTVIKLAVANKAQHLLNIFPNCALNCYNCMQLLLHKQGRRSAKKTGHPNTKRRQPTVCGQLLADGIHH